MIDETLLRDDLIRLLTATENNIRTRCEEEPSANRPLEDRYEAGRRAGRTGMTFSTWREGEITQAGVAWLLACVFVRFLEDNDLLDQVYLAGPGHRLKTAQDRRTVWYRSHAASSDREYLLDILGKLEHLPGLKGLLDRSHNPLWSLGPDGDGAKAIWDFFQSADPDTQVLRHDFTDTAKSTRFLGDLYQNISKAARKRYALVQTPDFIVDFILNRTLEPALKEFPLNGFRLIDPACGSGHFLLEAFERLFRRWASDKGELPVIVQKTLDCVYGVDLNPYAAAIARFRLLLAALRACGISKIAQAPDWQIHVAVGDSLIFGPNTMWQALTYLPAESPDQLRVIFQTQSYHVVVGNPPYINVQDPELRRLYRDYYKSCSGRYQISVPFKELFFALADSGAYVGMITSNAFMQKAFGKRLIESHLPAWDFTHIVDTSGVHLSSFGTPTVILIGRNRAPVSPTIRVVRGIRGEASAPTDPGNAPVWTEIRDRVDQADFVGTFVSVSDAPRNLFRVHPWPMGGGGAAELKERLDKSGVTGLAEATSDKGVFGMTNADDVLMAPAEAFRRAGIEPQFFRSVCAGEGIKDWLALPSRSVLFPYSETQLLQLSVSFGLYKWLWPAKTILGNRVTFNQSTYFKEGKAWWSWHQVALERLKPPTTITYPFVATIPQFALDPGNCVFSRTAPVIKPILGANAQEIAALVGILNSSVTCFWLRQVCRNKGTGGIGGGIATEQWEQFFEYDTSIVMQLPLPRERPRNISEAILAAAHERSRLLPAAIIASQIPTRASLDAARNRAETLLLSMIALQEELDWHVYHLYGLIDESLTVPIDQIPPVRLGERTFEILMARAMEAGDLETEWFNRHRSVPRTEIPDQWPPNYTELVQRRLDAIECDHDLALIEQPEYKRRWNLARWEELELEALRTWLLDRLEDPRYWPTNPPVLSSVARLADIVRSDREFLQVAELYRGRPDFEVTDLVQELVARESVPFLPLLRYKESGLRKRADWEHTWQLQRREDAGETVEIPVPPKYERTDFVADCWRLRGKLDVPKERWISYPTLERDTDKSTVIAWAGYDHGQQALALAGYANEMRINEGWTAERLIPVLVGIKQLQPWLDQWHNQIDPDRQQRLNESIRSFVESEMTQLGITTETIREWRPPARVTATKARKARPEAIAASKSPVFTN